MFTRNYRFGAYRRIQDEPPKMPAQAISEKLSILLHDGAMCIFKLVGIVQHLEALLAGRVKQHLGILQAWAPDLLTTAHPHRHFDCSDNDPKYWREDCPRCLACVVNALKDRRPY